MSETIIIANMARAFNFNGNNYLREKYSCSKIQIKKAQSFPGFR